MDWNGRVHVRNKKNIGIGYDCPYIKNVPDKSSFSIEGNRKNRNQPTKLSTRITSY